MQSFMAVTILRPRRYPAPLACKERARGQGDLALLLVRWNGGAVAPLPVHRAFPVADLACLSFGCAGRCTVRTSLFHVYVCISIPGVVCSGLCLPWRVLFASSFDGAPCRKEAARGGVGGTYVFVRAGWVVRRVSHVLLVCSRVGRVLADSGGLRSLPRLSVT